MERDRDHQIDRDRDRIARLEQDYKNLREWVMADNAELQALRASANMGKGAWALLIKLGAVLVAIAGAFAWLWDRFGGKHP